MIQHDTQFDEWSALIGELAECRQKLANLYPEDWPISYGGIAVSTQSIAEVESTLGYTLDPDHRDFLLHVDGWPNFFSDISILSLEELGRGPAWARASQLLTAYYEYPLPARFPLIGELFPIGVSAYQNDILAIVRTGPSNSTGNPVLWLANEEIERFSDMQEMCRFFLNQMKTKVSHP